MEKVNGLVDQRVNDRKCEVDGQLIYNEHQRRATVVLFKADVLSSSIDDAIAAI